MTSLKRSQEGHSLDSKISSKTFVRSTKRGKVQKIVREIYLRQDIPCSSKLCTTCPAIVPTAASGVVVPFVLSERPTVTKAFPCGHYLVPDTNILLIALDLFELSTHFYDVVILQTVLEELRNRSLPLYNRVIALCKSEEKRFYVFFNDFRLETYIERNVGETINDRNDRAVRTAVAWYQEHLKATARKGQGSPEVPAIVMLSEDVDNLRKAVAQGLNAVSLKSYVSKLPDADRLLDMVDTSKSNQPTNKNAEMFYPEHFTPSKMMTGVKAGVMHQGLFNVSQYNYLEGYIQVPAFEKRLLVLGRENINRAIQGDLVVIEVLPESQWRTPSTRLVEETTLNKDEDAEDEDLITTEREQRALQEQARKHHGSSQEGKSQPTAKVVGVIKRNWRQYVGHVDSTSANSSKQENRNQIVFVIPMDKRIPKIRLRTRQVNNLLGQRVLVTIDAWERDSRAPTGHFVRSLGGLETKEAETEALLLEYDVQYRPFTKTVLDCLPKEGHDWKVPTDIDDAGWKKREDLRNLSVCSIDPPNCQDIDDALHARLLPNGNYEVGVHIADVSHFVKPGNAMDSEASARGTTVYLVDKRIDMLPMLLGTDLCSLKPYVERYAFSVLWELTPSAQIVQSTFTKSVIRSREAFSYEAAQLRIDDTSQKDELTQGMRVLMMLSKKLRQQRMDAGALNLASPEVKVQIESETSDPVDVENKKLLDTNSLVEEFMLLANITVAQKNQSCFTQTALLRRHGAPPESNFSELKQQLKVRKGMTLETDSSKALADSLDRCVDPEEPFLNTLIRIMATRCMMSAEYFCAGTQVPSEYRHYGLATEIYTHFTSPIRRYADLIAHRQLAAAIGYEKVDVSLTELRLERVCTNINVRHRNAQLAGRASVEYYVGQALKGRVVEEDGFVMRVFENGIVIFVPRFGIEGVVRLKDISFPEPQSSFDPEKYGLLIKVKDQAERALMMFDKVRVKICDVLEESTGKRKVRVELL
ncbi:MAG: exosome catalytic subunit dis3 [Vezdaea aestivalis]|nr:MAG: exosome catalytic subunit dis3 [Vezdaea aestivalis]